MNYKKYIKRIHLKLTLLSNVQLKFRSYFTTKGVQLLQPFKDYSRQTFLKYSKNTF